MIRDYLCGILKRKDEKECLVEVQMRPRKKTAEEYRADFAELERNFGAYIAMYYDVLKGWDQPDEEYSYYIALVENVVRKIPKDFEEMGQNDYRNIYEYYRGILDDLADSVKELREEKIRKSFSLADVPLDQLIEKSRDMAAQDNHSMAYDKIRAGIPSTPVGLLGAFADVRKKSQKDRKDDGDDGNGSGN